MSSKVEIFCCYARKDRKHLNKLKTYLIPLQRIGLITLWADTDIEAGEEWEKEINAHLDTAQIILLLVSPDFIASDYCYSKEMMRAMERYKSGEAQVIPVILSHVHWEDTPFGKLQVLPDNARPVLNSWDSNKAFFNAAEGIRKVVEQLTAPSINISAASETISNKNKNGHRITKRQNKVPISITLFEERKNTVFKFLQRKTPKTIQHSNEPQITPKTIRHSNEPHIWNQFVIYRSEDRSLPPYSFDDPLYLSEGRTLMYTSDYRDNKIL